MTTRFLLASSLLGCLTIVPARATAEPETAAERGRRALQGHTFIPAIWPATAYQQAWRHWDGDRKQPPADYDRAFRERYGLHPAPYPNNGLPMGLREGRFLLGKGLAVDCMACHGGSIAGQSYLGLGNASLDVQALFEDLAAASGRPAKTPFCFSNVRGTSEAGGMGVFLLGLREPDLKLRTPRIELGLHDDLCEDVPAWWLLKKKKTMYYTGGTDARSVRSLMQFMTGSLLPPEAFAKEEPAFRDVQAYLLSLEPPKYPLPVDRPLAARGEAVFTDHCARCHGTYGEKWTYPNRIVPIDVIGTDRRRYDGITAEFGRYYNRSWFGREKRGWLADEGTVHQTVGYQAPPLDGIWATAPYLHNGSVPTVYDLLNSKSRPKLFTRSYRTDLSEYDPRKLGWKVRALERGPDESRSAFERRKVYDTSQPGRGNGGHTFGDRLTEAERLAVIEYLKTL